MRTAGRLDPVEPTDDGQTTIVLVDGHVHVHPCFTPHDVLVNGESNLRRAWSGSGPVLPTLLVVSTDDRPPLDAFADGQDALPVGWTARQTPEPNSLLLTEDGAPRLVLIGGWQIRSRERLELLVFGGSSAPELARQTGERSFARVLDGVVGTASAVIVPWAFGKWWLGRERVVRNALGTRSDDERARVFLGDNGNRPRRLGVPGGLTRLERDGYRVVPGSDPFPITKDVVRVGSFGLALPCNVDIQRPAESVFDALRNPATPATVLGSPTSLPTFVRNQIAIRLPASVRSSP